MNQYNPYEAPREGDAALDPGPEAEAHASIIEAFNKTRPWVMFMAILGYLGAALMVFMGLISMATSSVSGAFAGGPLSEIAPFFGFIYIVFGGVYLVPSTLLWRYAASIQRYTSSDGSMKKLARAIEKQASFWRFVGAMTAVLMALYAVVIFMAIVFAAGRIANH